MAVEQKKEAGVARSVWTSTRLWLAMEAEMGGVVGGTWSWGEVATGGQNMFRPDFSVRAWNLSRHSLT